MAGLAWLSAFCPNLISNSFSYSCNPFLMRLNPKSLHNFLFHLMPNLQCPSSQIKAAKEENKKWTRGLAKKFKLKYLGTVQNFFPQIARQLSSLNEYYNKIISKCPRFLGPIFSWLLLLSVSFGSWTKKLDNFVPVQSAK